MIVKSSDSKPTNVNKLTTEQRALLAAALVRIRDTQTLRNWKQFRVYLGEGEAPSTVKLLRYSRGKIAQVINVWGP